jgi:hypothetical protein
MKIIIPFILVWGCLLLPFCASAQQDSARKSLVAPQTERDTNLEKLKTEDNLGEKEHYDSQLLEQFSLGYSGVSPKVNLQTYKFSALIGKGYWDFYFHNSVPTVAPSPNDSIKYLTNDILQHAGGLLNVELGKVGYYGYGEDPSVRFIKGAQVDFRLGARLIDIPNRRTGNFQFIPTVQSSLDFRYLIPLVSSERTTATGEKRTLQDRMLGNLTFRFQGSSRYVFQSDTYDRYFETARGNAPNHLMLVGNAEVYFFVTNKIYLSAGYAFNNIPTVPNLPFFSVSYGGGK